MGKLLGLPQMPWALNGFEITGRKLLIAFAELWLWKGIWKWSDQHIFKDKKNTQSQVKVFDGALYSHWSILYIKSVFPFSHIRSHANPLSIKLLPGRYHKTTDLDFIWILCHNWKQGGWITFKYGRGFLTEKAGEGSKYWVAADSVHCRGSGRTQQPYSSDAGSVFSSHTTLTGPGALRTGRRSALLTNTLVASDAWVWLVLKWPFPVEKVVTMDGDAFLLFLARVKANHPQK